MHDWRWVLVDHKLHLVHSIRGGMTLTTDCGIDSDKTTGRWKYTCKPPRSVTCLMCLAEG